MRTAVEAFLFSAFRLLPSALNFHPSAFYYFHEFRASANQY